MAFTARHPNGRVIDATKDDLGLGIAWDSVYRSVPRVRLTCPECGWQVHAKRSSRRARFFAHDAGRPEQCHLAYESWAHHMVKLELAGAIREAGWWADLEVRAEDGSWRADVLASSPDGQQRMAWEVQLSPITLDDIRARTNRYAASGVTVCWVTSRREATRWMDAVPAIRVQAPQGAGPWTVDDGCAEFSLSHGTWVVVQDRTLPHFVHQVLGGRLSTTTALPHYELARALSSGQERRVRRTQWWATPRSAIAQALYDRRRQRLEAAAARRERERDAARARRRPQRPSSLLRAPRNRAATGLRRRPTPAEERTREQVLREERYAQERAELVALDHRAGEIAQQWWQRLSREQVRALFAAVRQHENAVVPQGRGPTASFAYGVPVFSRGQTYGLHGIVRPCPDLVFLSPQLAFQRLYVRNAHEADELASRGMQRERIRHFDLP